jgi:aryl-alcohol dehydrogenase-like predicted oxidoreductase
LSQLERHRLGKSDLVVSPVGLGCWAMGGPAMRVTGEERQPFGWGAVDDAESIRSIHRALDMGANFVDTANNYGAGHSERTLGRALDGRRHDAVLSTKFATVFDEERNEIYFDRELPMTYEEIRAACEGSLRRLRTDYIDLYHFHNGDYPAEQAGEVRDILERLVEEGKIRWYGWSTDDPGRARVFAEGAHCATVQYRMNITWDASKMIELTRELGLGSVVRSPLNGGFLTGKFTPDTTFPEDDGRHSLNLREGTAALRLRQIDLIRGILTEDGRSVAQGSLGWIWGKHPEAVPIPGFKSVAQVEENVAAARYGPLNGDQIGRIEALLAEVQTG